MLNDRVIVLIQHSKFIIQHFFDIPKVYLYVLKARKMRNKKLFSPIVFFVIAFVFLSCNNSSTENTSAEVKAPAKLIENTVDYTSDTTKMNGYVVYSDSFEGKRPAILVVHEWWGQNDYTRNRAKQLAELGYIAMAVDMYGNGQTAANPDEAMKLAGPFYGNPQLAKNRMDAALQKLKTFPQTDTSKIAAIGYCYGGFVVLNAARLGEPLKAVVTFHGDLSGVKPDKKLLKADILVCHGEADSLVPAAVVATFKKQMDSIGAPYTFKSYPNAMHAFTNPASTETGKKFKLAVGYNADADKNSWNDMKEFLERIFK
jgi:dienelactone hydrolase